MLRRGAPSGIRAGEPRCDQLQPLHGAAADGEGARGSRSSRDGGVRNAVLGQGPPAPWRCVLRAPVLRERARLLPPSATARKGPAGRGRRTRGGAGPQAVGRGGGGRPVGAAASAR
eukprot:4348486-Prymnesium_polylepis.1